MTALHRATPTRAGLAALVVLPACSDETSARLFLVILVVLFACYLVELLLKVTGITKRAREEADRKREAHNASAAAENLIEEQQRLELLRATNPDAFELNAVIAPVLAGVYLSGHPELPQRTLVEVGCTDRDFVLIMGRTELARIPRDAIRELDVREEARVDLRIERENSCIAAVGWDRSGVRFTTRFYTGATLESANKLVGFFSRHMRRCSTEGRQCPHCCESIELVTTKCKHCGSPGRA